MASISSRRLAKELLELKTKGPPPGIELLEAEDMSSWVLSVRVLGESVYQGEVFALRFKFGPRYPIDSPEVTFVVSHEYQPPQHGHCYTNGHICASILGDAWSPVLNVQTICITLQSMLASSKRKELPPGNDEYVRRAPKSPKDARFVYDDDTV